MGDNFVPELVGFVTGVITACVVGIVFCKIRGYWKKVTAIGKPQEIKLTTEKTPWQVLVDGCMSLFKLISLIILVLVGIFLFGAASVFGWEKVISFVMIVAQLR